MGLWYKPWFYRYVQTFLKKVGKQFKAILKLMLYYRFLYWLGYLAGWNGGVRSDPALPPASQQTHVLANPHVPALGSQPNCKVTSAIAFTDEVKTVGDPKNIYIYNKYM